MTYDDWKLRSPDDDGPQEQCWHEDYESNWEGRATCDRCGHSWWLSSAELEAERAASAAFDAYCRSAERRERFEGWIHRLAFWRRWRRPAPINDEVPF